MSVSAIQLALRYARLKGADLDPPLGYPGGSCTMIDRIVDRVSNPQLKERLISKIEMADELTHPEANTIYSPELERGVKGTSFKRVVFEPHAQYRMDLRGVTVPDVLLALREFHKAFGLEKSRKTPRSKTWDTAYQTSEKIVWRAPSGLTVVFRTGLINKNEVSALIVTTFWEDRNPGVMDRKDCLPFDKWVQQDSRTEFEKLFRTADLNPPLGYPGGPCHLINRIDEEVKNPRLRELLVDEIEGGHSLSNNQASKVYEMEEEAGPGGKWKTLLVTSHAQYRMDQRGVTVPEVRLSLRNFQKTWGDLKSRQSPQARAWERDMSYGETIQWDDPKTGLTVVFTVEGSTVVIVTVYWKGVPDPHPVDESKCSKVAHKWLASHTHRKEVEPADLAFAEAHHLPLVEDWSTESWTPASKEQPAVSCKVLFPARGKMTLFGMNLGEQKRFVLADVPFKDLIPCQPTVPLIGLKKYAEGEETLASGPPEVVLDAGNLYIHSGHTRLSALGLKGASRVQVKLYLFEDRKFSRKPSDADLPPGVGILSKRSPRLALKQGPEFTNTFVSPKSRDNLPTDTDREKQTVLPPGSATPGSGGRDIPKFENNGPDSDSNIQPRTLGVPGEEYGSPYKDNTDGITRRTMTSASPGFHGSPTKGLSELVSGGDVDWIRRDRTESVLKKPLTKSFKPWSLDFLGVWVTSSRDHATIYGSNIYQVEVPDGKYLRGSTPFQDTFFDYYLACQYFSDKVLKWLSGEMRGSDPNVGQIFEKYLKGMIKINLPKMLQQVGRTDNTMVQLALKEVEEIFRHSRDYLLAWRDLQKGRGYDGVKWESSKLDVGSEDSPHDAFLLWRNLPVKAEENLDAEGLDQARSRLHRVAEYAPARERGGVNGGPQRRQKTQEKLKSKRYYRNNKTTIKKRNIRRYKTKCRRNWHCKDRREEYNQKPDYYERRAPKQGSTIVAPPIIFFLEFGEGQISHLDTSTNMVMYITQGELRGLDAGVFLRAAILDPSDVDALLELVEQVLGSAGFGDLDEESLRDLADLHNVDLDSPEFQGQCRALVGVPTPSEMTAEQLELVCDRLILKDDGLDVDDE